jgi:hypothetical protein
MISIMVPSVPENCVCTHTGFSEGHLLEPAVIPRRVPGSASLRRHAARGFDIPAFSPSAAFEDDRRNRLNDLASLMCGATRPRT